MAKLKLQEKGGWYLIRFPGHDYYAKLMDEDVEGMAEKAMVPLHHPTMIGPNGALVYLPTTLKVRDPWMANLLQMETFVRMNQEDERKMDNKMIEFFRTYELKSRGVKVEGNTQELMMREAAQSGPQGRDGKPGIVIERG